MKSDHKKLLGNVFSEVIEKLAFMFGEEAEKKELITNGSRFIQARMTFTGDMAGALTLVVSENMCSEIAANILGTDPEDKIEKARSRDALKEVLNVTCGNFLTAIAGNKPVFELSVPMVSEIDETGRTALLNDPETTGLLVDDSPVLLHFSLENQK